MYKKIILAIIIAILSFAKVNAGFPCEPVWKDNTYKNYNLKIDNFYKKINNFPIDKKSKVFIRIEKMLYSGGKLDKFKSEIQEKYGFKSEQYKKIDAIYKRIYCNNQKGQNELVNNFFDNFDTLDFSDNDKYNPLNDKKIIRNYFIDRVFDDEKNIILNRDTFIVLRLEDNKGVAVDKNFLYFYKKGWPGNIKNVVIIKDYKSFKIYDGMLLGDDYYFLNGEKTTHIDLKTFKRINKKTVAYKSNGKDIKDYFYYEDEAYFYQKRNSGIYKKLEKIGIKSKKLEILSRYLYKYGDKIYFEGELLLDKNINNFKLVNKLLGNEKSSFNLNIIGRDDKNIYYINFMGYGGPHFGKLEFDYDTLEVVSLESGDIVFKDKNNTFKYANGEITKIKNRNGLKN